MVEWRVAGVWGGGVAGGGSVRNVGKRGSHTFAPLQSVTVRAVSAYAHMISFRNVIFGEILNDFN